MPDSLPPAPLDVPDARGPAPTSPDPFADLMGAEAGGEKPPGDDPFADLHLENLPAGRSSAAGAFASHAARGVLPTAGGMAAAGAGAELGGEIGALAGPFGAGAGALIGGIGGFFLGSSATEGAQDYALKQAPDNWQETLGQSSRIQRLQEAQHPYASFMGGIAPYAVTMTPGAFTTKAAGLAEDATNFQKLMANPVTARIFGGAAMGGMELGQEEWDGQTPDWAKVGISTGFGVIFNKPTAFGEYLTGLGARPVVRFLRPQDIPAAGALNPAEPTVAQAQDLGVIGPGSTEQTFRGDEQQSLSTKTTAQNAAADEQAALGTIPPPDLDAIARRLEPDLFRQNDQLVAQRDALRSWIQDQSNPTEDMFDDVAARRYAAEEALRNANPNGPAAKGFRAELAGIAQEETDLVARRQAWESGTHVDTPDVLLARQHLLDTEHALWDLGPEISAARRRAADHAGEIEAPALEPTAAEAPPPQGPQNQPTMAPTETVAPAPKSIEAQRAFITSDRTAQLMAAGLSRQVAETSAHVEAAYYETLAARFQGALGNAEDLYRQRAARVVGPNGAPPESTPPVTRTAPTPIPVPSVADIQARDNVSATVAKATQVREQPGGVALAERPQTEAQNVNPDERPRIRSGGDIAKEEGIKDPKAIRAIQDQETLALVAWQARNRAAAPRPKRNPEMDRLSASVGLPKVEAPVAETLAAIVDRLPEERIVEEINAEAEAGEIEYREAEKDAAEVVPEVVENPDAFYDSDQSRPLEELESEHRPPAETVAAEQRPGSGGEPAIAAANQGEVPEGGGPPGVEPGVGGRAGPEEPATGVPEPVAEPGARPAIIPTAAEPGSAPQSVAGVEQRVAAGAEPAGVTDRPGLVTHVTKRGKTLTGVIREGLNHAEARAIDPYTFRKDGGWFIRTANLPEDAPEMTAPAEEVPAAKVQAQRAKQADRLREIASRLEAQASEDENRERQTNTARRATMAASATNDARARLQIAGTMQNIADAIENGEAEHLSGVQNRAQVEQLDQILRQSRYARERAENVSYADQQRREGAPITEADIAHAVMPNVYIHRAWAKDAASEIERSAQRGNASVTRWLRDVSGDRTLSPDPEKTEQLREALAAVRKKSPKLPPALNRIAESLADRDRITKMGITNDAELRTALSEFNRYRGARKEESPIARLERGLIGQKPGVDFFPTPAPLVQRLIEEADIQPGMRVLEPSAGKGDIADALRDAGAQVDTVEVSSTLRDILQAKGHNVVGQDFMEFEPAEKYDRIVMNPPFSNNLDAAHVQQAYDMLKPGGRLVAITGEGVHFRENRTAAAFRDWLNEHDAEVEKLPEGSFRSAFRPTGVATRLVTVEKPAEGVRFEYSQRVANVSEAAANKLAVDALNGDIPQHLAVDGLAQLLESGAIPEAVARINLERLSDWNEGEWTAARERQRNAIGELEQRAKDIIQGRIRMAPGDVRSVIILMRTADASTFMHETAHDWLRQLLRDALHVLAPDQLKADAATVRNWLRRPSDWTGFKRDGSPDVGPQERFARAFEQYLREGHAPSRPLDSVFQKFGNWLKTIYRTLRGLGAPISDGIKQVFDRMLAIEPQRRTAGEVQERPPSLGAIHEADANETHPREADAVADRIASERGRAVAAPPPEIAHEVAGIQEPGGTAQPGAEAGPGGAGPGEVEGRGGQPGPVAPGGGMGAGPGTVGGSRSEAAPKGSGVAEPAGQSNPPGGRRSPGTNPATPVEQFAPQPAESLGNTESRLVDLAGNIRVENLTDVESIAAAIHDSAERNDEFKAVRGGMTKGRMSDLADGLGLDPASINEIVLTRLLGGTDNLGAKILAARRLAVQSAEIVSGLMKTASETGSDQDLGALATAIARHDVIQAALSGVTAEWGRAGNAFHSLLAGWGKAQDLNQLLKDNLGRDLYQLKIIAKMGARLDTPGKISKYLRDAKNRSFGGMLLEYWINGLISGLATHATYTVGNTILNIEKAGPETAMAALIGSIRAQAGRQGTRVRMGEVGAQFRAAVREAPATMQAAIEALRTGATTQLPGEAARPVMPFQGDTSLIMGRGMTNSPVTWHEAIGDAYAAIQGLRDGLAATGQLVSAGGVSGAPLIGAEFSPLGQIPNIQVRGATVLPIGTMARLPSRMIATIHSGFRAMGYSMEINALAYRQASDEGLLGAQHTARMAELRQNPSEEMMALARRPANDLALMGQAGKFTQALQRLTSTTFNIPGLGETALLKFIDPFVHIAGNIMNQSLMQRTPIGLLGTEIRADLMGKNGNVAQDTAMAKMLVGTAVGATFAGLAAQGLVSGSGPAKPNEAAMWRLAGNQAHSIRIGNVWYAMNRLGPMGMLASVSADMYDVAHQIGAEDADVVGKSLIHAFTQNILDESWMRGPADLIQAVTESDRYGAGYVRNFATSFLPYSVGMAQMARASDPWSRQARTLMDAVKSKIPGLSESLYPRRDIWGEPMPSGDALLAPGVTAIYERKMSADPVNQAMLALSIFPAPVERRIRNVRLTDAQYDYFALNAGAAAKMRLDQFVRSPEWSSMTNEGKHYWVVETMKQARESAAGKVMMRWPEIARQGALLARSRLTGEPVPSLH